MASSSWRRKEDAKQRVMNENINTSRLCMLATEITWTSLWFCVMINILNTMNAIKKKKRTNEINQPMGYTNRGNERKKTSPDVHENIQKSYSRKNTWFLFYVLFSTKQFCIPIIILTNTYVLWVAIVRWLFLTYFKEWWQKRAGERKREREREKDRDSHSRWWGREWEREKGRERDETDVFACKHIEKN